MADTIDPLPDHILKASLPNMHGQIALPHAHQVELQNRDLFAYNNTLRNAHKAVLEFVSLLS
jgi:hypothetical protein